MEGLLPAIVTVYSDRSFSFVIKTPPVSYLLKKAAGIEKGSGEVPRVKSGKITRSQVEEIAKTKLADLNADNLEAALRIVEGTARSMGIEIV
jgi:large subunit ribosomal protein L11